MQLVLVLAAGRHTRLICTAAPFTNPAAQRRTRQLHCLLTSLTGTALAPLPRLADRRMHSAARECANVVTWLRLAVALLLPLLLEAWTEARLWRMHQAQRRRAGLTPERCGRLKAAVYLAAGWLDVGWNSRGGGRGALGEDARLSGGTLQTTFVIWLLLTAAWEWCACILRL